MEKLIEKVQSTELGARYWHKVTNLSPFEIKILVIVTVTLILFLVMKKLGPKIAMALGMLFLIIYTLYINNFLSVYSLSQEEKDLRLGELQAELNK